MGRLSSKNYLRGKLSSAVQLMTQRFSKLIKAFANIHKIAILNVKSIHLYTM